MTLRDQIEEIIESEPVALFMKGTPQLVMCGNSAAGAAGADERRRAGYDGGHPARPADPPGAVGLSGWPTIPQVFVRGELIGGADICEELPRAASSSASSTRRSGRSARAR